MEYVFQFLISIQTIMTEKKTEVEWVENLDGPKRDRSITDCIFCLIMLLFWVGCTALMVWAFATGNPYLLTQVYDFNKTPCGSAVAGTVDFKFAYFYQPLQNFTNVVCLSNCPTWSSGGIGPLKLPCFSPNLTYNSLINDCSAKSTYDLINLETVLGLPETDNFLIYNTTALLNRFCIPSLDSLLSSANSFQNISAVTESTYKFQQYLSDATVVWRYYMIIGVIGILLSISMLCFIKCCAGVIIWLILIIFVGSLFGLAVISGSECTRLTLAGSTSKLTSSSSVFTNANTFYALEIFFYVLSGVSVIVVLVSISTIMITIAVVKSTAQFIYSNLTVLLVPLFSGITIAGYIVLWIASFLYIFSVGTYKPSDNSPFADITWNQNVQWFMVFHVLALLWNVAFLRYYGVFVISCTCSIWYFNSDFSGSSYFSLPVLTSSWWGIRYHLGSLGLGSFILMFFWALQLCLMYLSQYINGLKQNGIESKILDLFVKCLMCYVSCFTRIIEFISELGYAQVAISCQNFCTSCMEAFKLLVSNPMKFGVVGFVGTTFVIIGNLFIAGACGVIGWVLLSYQNAFSVDLHEKFVPVFFFVVIGYFTSSIFFAVFGTTANTVLLCFFYDKDLATKNGRPPNAPEPMREFYEKYKSSEEQKVD